MPKLIAQSEEFSGKIFELKSPEYTVGRLADNKIQLEHNSVSGHHAELLLDGVDYKVKDLDSTNGTRVNGERITEHKLRRNDIVRFGNIELLYDSEHAPPAQPMPEPSQGINVSQSVSHGKPADFTNASPFPKKSSTARSSWTVMIAGAALVAIAGVGYFVYRLFFNS